MDPGRAGEEAVPKGAAAVGRLREHAPLGGQVLLRAACIVLVGRNPRQLVASFAKFPQDLGPQLRVYCGVDTVTGRRAHCCPQRARPPNLTTFPLQTGCFLGDHDGAMMAIADPSGWQLAQLVPPRLAAEGHAPL